MALPMFIFYCKIMAQGQVLTGNELAALAKKMPSCRREKPVTSGTGVEGVPYLPDPCRGLSRKAVYQTAEADHREILGLQRWLGQCFDWKKREGSPPCLGYG